VRATKATAFVVIIGLVFVLVEGLSSTAIAVFQMLRQPSPSEASRYDESLGWVGIPSTYIPDMYGPGKYVRTNARGFRNDNETEVAMPSGKLRIICSGNSFTYGQGVANNRTWCHRISELNSRFETVNMGQIGYGVDQMFLRYLRNGIVLEHSIHIFAFVGGDLNRMAFRSHHNNYGTPVLKLDDGELVADNVPVPRLRWWVSRVVRKADLRSVDFAQRVLARLFPAKADKSTLIEIVGPVASKIFQTVHRLSDEKNIVSVFVFLPAEPDIGEDTAWRRWVVATMDTLELPFIDITPALRGVQADRAASFLIRPSLPAAGHYTEAGNEWVAEVLYNHLMEISQIRTLLAGSRSSQLGNGQSRCRMIPPRFSSAFEVQSELQKITVMCRQLSPGFGELAAA
jgi:hypothetical protein